MEQAKRVAIVTGGSRGIGRAIAVALASFGHRIVLSFREREQDTQAVVEKISAARAAMCAVCART